MAIDHSLSYRHFRLRNIPHHLRLFGIEKAIRRLHLQPGATYADFGCSNGYITERIRTLAHCGPTYGFDHSEDLLRKARMSYPSITFSLIDLNRPNLSLPKCDLVTCFETLEHVGDPNTALSNILNGMKPGGIAIVTVPIEIGWRGILKFAIKTGCYGYDLTELPRRPGLFRGYVSALVKGDRLSRFRDKRQGWGTHFGFDHRDIDDRLHELSVSLKVQNSGTTRFYFLAQ